MRNINEVIMSGNLIKDPTTRHIDENAIYTDFMVAVNRKARQVDGQWIQDTDYVPVSSAGRNAERIAELAKGSSITFRGSVESYSYEKDEKKNYGIRLRLAEIISMDKK